ncbi:hypothetical protein Xcel_0966 [Xylanimonas cellulosilytica DSM 15894]|uniref:Uncharacterized protein n=1 Tax=Xylanimonas cellulosilytica (strain DSM 15894 / JCM 12276 / CECT 5975 / KCTC 9989 / LMG 20990 / NBRC 107835 / XIL07) TaxID=446471 RepID=D1BYS2_XYLCX|nr:hypothetical protein [Xylanimonas cellulosilytica]ACZ29997.1 hypothetical protein Xcel_0966 [Xylanimonas cellulosilytica DSM 15894]
MLGRSERESPAHATLAAELGGWSRLVEPDAPAATTLPTTPAGSQPGDLLGGGAGEPGGPPALELLDLGTNADTLATVASIAGLAAVVHLGHPEQPAPALEEALLAGDPSLMLTAAVPVRTQWVWAGRPGASGGAVVIDEAGLRDCRDVLRTLGVSPRLVPTRTPVAERAEIAGPDGSLVVERPRVPAGLVELAGSERLSDLPPVWYGLLESRAAWPRYAGPAQVWLAFGPYDDHRGSLQPTLAVIADAGIDLQHLRSHPSARGPHVFFTSFLCPRVEVLDTLGTDLDARGIAYRVLAVLPGEGFVPGPAALAPRWSGA